MDAPSLPTAWLRALVLYQACIGGLGLLLAALSPLAALVAARGDPDLESLGPFWSLGLTTGILLLVFGGPGLLSALSAYGLHKGRPWGWWAAAISLAVGLSSIIGLPFSVAGLWLLFLPAVRAAYAPKPQLAP